MYFHHIIILALVQGITEFLPISSSGHLVITHQILSDGAAGDHWGKELTMDVAVHVGTLFSVLVYFRRDLARMLTGALKAYAGGKKSGESQLGILVLFASVPVVLGGMALEIFEPGFLRNPSIIAWTTLIFGVILWWADKYFSGRRHLDDLNIWHALVIGIAQTLALVPGVSRSGITMTAGRLFGYSRTESARFSLLLAVVAISGAGALQGWELLHSRNAVLGYEVLLAAVIAFLSGLLTISLMMRWLSRATFTPFAIYRILLGLVLLAL